MSDSEAVKVQITELRAHVERKDLILKLEQYPEFKKIFHDIFFESECARFARMSADPALPTQNRADAMAMAQAAGLLKIWLSTQIRMGNRAADEIRQIEESIEDEKNRPESDEE